jgi:hypothetical protein
MYVIRRFWSMAEIMTALEERTGAIFLWRLPSSSTWSFTVPATPSMNSLSRTTWGL